MKTKAFQNKQTLFFDEGENRAFMTCYSVTLAESNLQCAKLSLNSKYRPPTDGWSEDVLELAKRLKGKKVVRERTSDKNFYYLARSGN